MHPRDAPEQLLAVAGEALGPPLDAEAADGTIPRALRSLLARRNGFYAFGSALHVFPAGRTVAPSERSLESWNAPGLWRDSFGGTAAGHRFFAEDAFGGQFTLKDGSVHTFDPETGASEWLADDVPGWCAAVLGDLEFLTGHPLAHAWQLQHGRLAPGRRLVPKQPFVLGGAFSVENLHDVDAVEGMRLRAELAVQLRDLPDGATVRWTVVD